MLTDEQLKEIKERSQSYVITYEDEVPIVSWCEDDKYENYEAEIPEKLAESAQDDIPNLLAHIEHQQRALEWLASDCTDFCDDPKEAIELAIKETNNEK